MTPAAPNVQSTATRPPTASTFKPRVRRLGPGRYLVESQTRPGVGHPVTLDRCNCPGFSYRGTCRHIALVRAIDPRMQAWYAQREGQATVAAPVAGIDAQIIEAERRLASAHRALADTDEQSDEYALLLRHVQQAERAYAALDSRAMRAA